MSKFLVFIMLIVVSFCTSKNERPSEEYSLSADSYLDTIIFKQSRFTSYLDNKIGDCLVGRFVVDTFKKSDATSVIKVLNKELRTLEFAEIIAVTGKNIKFNDYDRWARVMELYFENEENATKWVKLLETLDSGVIQHTIHPTKFVFKRTGAFSVFLLQYTPVLNGEPEEIHAFYECI